MALTPATEIHGFIERFISEEEQSQMLNHGVVMVWPNFHELHRIRFVLQEKEYYIKGIEKCLVHRRP